VWTQQAKKSGEKFESLQNVEYWLTVVRSKGKQAALARPSKTMTYVKGTGSWEVGAMGQDWAQDAGRV
jgi:hypothetical protein